MTVFTDYKRAGYAIAMMVLAALMAQAQPEAQVTSGNLFNAGKLATDAAPVPVRWELVNGGTEPLLLGEGVSTDDGLRGSWPRKAIAPGQRFAVEGTFDPKNHRRGNFVSQLQIESNARTGRVLLTAFGLAHAPGENPYYYATTGNGPPFRVSGATSTTRGSTSCNRSSTGPASSVTT